MREKQGSSASEDGVTLFKAIGLLVLAVPLVVVGSLAGAFGGHWLLGVPFWAGAAVAAWKARGRLAREVRLYDRESAHPLAVLDTSSERDRCPCCRYPTLEAGDDTCLLCDWHTPDTADTIPAGLTLREARENFGRHLSAYAPETAPEWVTMSDEEAHLKRRLIAAYKRIERGGRSAWYKARSLEGDLAAARHRGIADYSSHPDLELPDPS